MSEQQTVVSIGSAVLDVILKSSTFVPTPINDQLMLCEIFGGKANVDDVLIASGGAGTNTAVSFARQGYAAVAVAEIGTDLPAQIIEDDLAKDGVTTRYLIRESEEKTGISAILVATDGSRSALTYRGASHMLSHQDLPLDILKTARHVHLSSVGSADVIREIMLLCKENKVSLSWNPSRTELEEVVLRSGQILTDVCLAIFVNDLEYAGIVGQEQRFEQMAQYIVVTRGKLGGDVYTQGEKHEYHAKEADVVDETGAGDAFASGMVGSLLSGKTWQEAVEFGVLNAASVVSKMGAKAGLLSGRIDGV